MKARIHVVHLNAAHTGFCAVCGEHGVYRHYDTELKGLLCHKDKEFTIVAEIELRAAFNQAAS